MAAPQPPDNRPRNLIDAIACFRRGELENCKKLLALTRLQTPRGVHPEVILYEGLCERRLGNRQRAVEILQEAARVAPTEPQVLLAYGLALIETGRTEWGLDMLRSAVHASGEAPTFRHEFYLQNGIALYREKYLEAAITSLRKAQRFAQEASTYRLLGYILLEQEKHEEALAVANEGLSHHMYDPELHHIAGLALAMGRDLVAAAQSLIRAVEINPHNGEPLHSLGLCFESMGDGARALRAYQQCLTLPCRPSVHQDARDRVARLTGHADITGLGAG